MRTLVIIPAYNEQDNIIKLIDELNEYKYDYLIINDCSTDNTKKILDENNYSHLDLALNVGLAGVTRIGFKYAYDHNYDCVVCVDGDGQHRPDYIECLVKEIENGYDYVVGSRFLTKGKPNTMRMLGSRLICFCIKLKTGKRVTDPTSGMRALSKKVLKVFSKEMNYFAEPDALCHIIRKKYKVKEVQVEMREREGGTSYFANPFKTIKFMLGVILSIIFVQW